jgi:hypothetical protein
LLSPDGAESVKSIPCAVENCGGMAVPTRKDGRFYLHRDVWINVPPHIVIPKCDRCGMDMFTDDLYKVLLQVLEVEYQVHAEMIKTIRSKNEAKAA